MNFVIRRGVPEVERLWSDLDQKLESGTLSKAEAKLLKKLVKIAGFLAANPFHNSLQSHEIDALSRRYGRKVFQSYMENQTPAAGRMFWVYGPGEREITIIGIEPHPEDQKSRGYDRIPLSDLPPRTGS